MREQSSRVPWNDSSKVLRDVCDHAGLFQALDQTRRRSSFCRPPINPPFSLGLLRVNRSLRRVWLGRSAGRRDAANDGQATAVLHQGMAQMAQTSEPEFLTLGFPEQSAIRISLGFAGAIAQLLPSVIDFDIDA